MSSLEEPEESGTAGTETAADGATEHDVVVSIPDDASDAEAAAISAAISAHVTDRQRAAAAAAASASADYVDEWVLEGRLARFGKRRRPREVERGEEWQAAARARY